MEGRAPLERQHTRHCTTSSGQMGPVLASSWGTPVYSRQCSVMVQAVGTVCLLHRNKNKIMSMLTYLLDFPYEL